MSESKHRHRKPAGPHSDSGLPRYEITLAEALQTKGYTCGVIGKWHLGHLRPFLPTQNGFDYYYGIPYSNDMNPVVLCRNNEVIESPVEQASLTERYTEKALQFINSAQAKPFLLYLAYTMPHTPLHVGDQFRGKSPRGLYGDAVEAIDWSVGRVLDRLAELGLDAKTLVVFTSDNGPWLPKGLDGGSAGLLRGGKDDFWEGGIREPFIARWPGRIPPGRVSREVAITMDLFPTFCEIAGVTAPSDRHIDGKNILPLLEGDGKSPHDLLLFFRGINSVAAVRKGPWKYVIVQKGTRNSPRETVELYNLLTDPSGTINLANDYPEIVLEIELQIKEFMKNYKPGQSERAPAGMLEEWSRKYPKLSRDVTQITTSNRGVIE